MIPYYQELMLQAMHHWVCMKLKMAQPIIAADFTMAVATEHSNLLKVEEEDDEKETVKSPEAFSNPKKWFTW
jgi:hypothetical protein